MVNEIRRIMADFIPTASLFIMMLSLTAFALKNNDQQLTLIWICSTFVLQTSINGLFTHDYYSGILEQIFIQPPSSRLIISYKIFLHWILFGSTVSIISFIFSLIIFDNDIKYAIAIGLSLLFNTLIIINISATGHSLTLGRSNLALAISQVLVLPMLIPTFVYFELLTRFGTFSFNNSILVAILVFVTLIINSTIATHAALKLAVEQD